MPLIDAVLGNKRLLGENWLRGSFDSVLVARSRSRATNCDPIAECQKEQIRPQFSYYRFKMNQRLLIGYEPTLIRFGSNILKIATVSVLSDTAFIVVFFSFQK